MEKAEWEREFPITSVTRQALVGGLFSTEQVASLSDDDMRAIASGMERTYLGLLFWESLETEVLRCLVRKQRRNI